MCSTKLSAVVNPPTTGCSDGFQNLLGESTEQVTQTQNTTKKTFHTILYFGTYLATRSTLPPRVQPYAAIPTDEAVRQDPEMTAILS